MLSKASLKSNIITVGIFFIISRLKEVTRKYHTSSQSIEWFLKDNLPLKVK